MPTAPQGQERRIYTVFRNDRAIGEVIASNSAKGFTEAVMKYGPGVRVGYRASVRWELFSKELEALKTVFREAEKLRVGVGAVEER